MCGLITQKNVNSSGQTGAAETLEYPSMANSMFRYRQNASVKHDKEIHKRRGYYNLLLTVAMETQMIPWRRVEDKPGFIVQNNILNSG